MSEPPDCMYRMSEALSEVMDDIGVNEKLLMERRRSLTLREALMNHSNPKETTSFFFGSQMEGSTTLGLCPDIDVLINIDFVSVIQHMGEWKPRSRFSGMMIQNENIQPGYCYLEVIRSDEKVQLTANYMKNTVIDSVGRILLLNTFISAVIPNHGPAVTREGIPGNIDMDLVPSLRCNSSPLQATSWLDKLSDSKWPSEDDKTFCRNAGCFVVSACSKLSDMPKYECRISTSLQERCLMFSLNITQLRCYVLVKMILKTHIHPHVEDVLSSYMCKNVLLYCVYNSSHESSQEWHTGNLQSYIHLCLFMLKERILQRNCPHLMIPENNLLAGRMTDSQRGKLLDIIDKLMEYKEELLYKIQSDYLGRRLMMKLNIIPSSPAPLSATEIATEYLCSWKGHIVGQQSDYVDGFLEKMSNDNLEVTRQKLSKLLSDLEKDRAEGNLIKKNVCDLRIPLVKSTLGSVIASINIDAQAAISDEAFAYLEAGKESDEVLGRLKLVSVLYCTGDIERAERELKISQQLCKISINKSISCCFPRQRVLDKLGNFNPCHNHNEEAIKFLVVVCTRFLNNETNCVPHELRYEILKSYIEEDRQMRTEEDPEWMNRITVDFIAVDSIPYLFFLQYKTYGLLQRWTEQREALVNLVRIVEMQLCLHHIETSMNLLGQCYEQENEQAEAFQCYIWSLRFRKRKNAARFLLCIQMFKLWKKYNV